MRSLHSRIALLPLVLLQGCLNIWTTDVLQRSSSTVAAPPAAIHVPAAAKGVRIQTSLAVEGGPDGSRERRLVTDAGSDGDSWAEGPTRVSWDGLRLEAQGSLLIQQWVRVGLGVGASKSGIGLSFISGGSTPGPWPVELFGHLGARVVSSRTEWKVSRHESDDDWRRDTTWLDTASSSIPRLGALAGLHFGRRAGGPWIEGSLGYQQLFDAPATEVTYAIRTQDLAAGWLHRFENGAMVAYVRARRAGAGWIPPSWKSSDWTPSVGVQWTGEIALTRRGEERSAAGF